MVVWRRKTDYEYENTPGRIIALASGASRSAGAVATWRGGVARVGEALVGKMAGTIPNVRRTAGQNANCVRPCNGRAGPLTGGTSDLDAYSSESRTIGNIRTGVVHRGARGPASFTIPARCSACSGPEHVRSHVHLRCKREAVACRRGSTVGAHGVSARSRAAG